MRKPLLLYICLNDGSDTRINKEVRTLSQQFAIHYIGIGRSREKSFVAPFCLKFTIIQGRHKEPLTLLKWWFTVAARLLFGKYDSIHLINEQLILLFYPLLLVKSSRVVLDIFDSIFLRKNGRMAWLQQVVYKLPDTILVTDDNRKGLMPAYAIPKVRVVENYPYAYTDSMTKDVQRDQWVIFYNGSMSRSRGTDLLRHLLEQDKNLKVRMAGWVYDEATRELSGHPQVEFLGVVPQQESMRVAAACQYILSLYEPSNENNINASPNKIYDAIQVCTPVIINREVKIARFVEENQIGYVLDSFSATNYDQILADLKRMKNKFAFHESLRQHYTWEAIERKLLAAHTR